MGTAGSLPAARADVWPPAEASDRGRDAEVGNVVVVKVGAPYNQYLEYTFNPFENRQHHEGWYDKIASGVVQEAIDSGAPTSSAGWVPIDSRSWNLGWSWPVSATPQVALDPRDRFTGRLINRYTLELLDRGSILASQDASRWVQYSEICYEIGVDPVLDLNTEETDTGQGPQGMGSEADCSCRASGSNHVRRH